MNRTSVQLSANVCEYQRSIIKFTAVSLEFPYLEVIVLHFYVAYVSMHVISKFQARLAGS